MQLLRSGKSAGPVLGKLVCSCNNVGEGNLINKIKEGCKDHLQLCQLAGAGMGCGSCRPGVKAILDSQVNVIKKRRSCCCGLNYFCNRQLYYHNFIEQNDAAANNQTNYFKR